MDACTLAQVCHRSASDACLPGLARRPARPLRVGTFRSHHTIAVRPVLLRGPRTRQRGSASRAGPWRCWRDLSSLPQAQRAWMHACHSCTVPQRAPQYSAPFRRIVSHCSISFIGCATSVFRTCLDKKLEFCNLRKNPLMFANFDIKFEILRILRISKTSKIPSAKLC